MNVKGKIYIFHWYPAQNNNKFKFYDTLFSVNRNVGHVPPKVEMSHFNIWFYRLLSTRWCKKFLVTFYFPDFSNFPLLIENREFLDGCLPSLYTKIGKKILKKINFGCSLTPMTPILTSTRKSYLKPTLIIYFNDKFNFLISPRALAQNRVKPGTN